MSLSAQEREEVIHFMTKLALRKKTLDELYTIAYGEIYRNIAEVIKGLSEEELQEAY